MKKKLRLTVRAHARSILILRLGTRPDGFTSGGLCFRSIELHDTLTVRSVPDQFAVKSRTAVTAADPSNLVWKAAAGLWKALGRPGDPSTMVNDREDDPDGSGPRRRQC